MSTLSDKKYNYKSSLVSRITRTYIIAMLCVNALVLIAFSYINLSYLYTDELLDMASRVALQFEDTMKQPMMEEYFNNSRTDYYLQQLDDLNKYSRPEKVRIFVVFPNGVTSQYNEEEERVTFELLPPDFFPIFREAVLNDAVTTEYPGVSNHFGRWTVAIPLHGPRGGSGGMVITSISTRDVLKRLIPVFIAVGLALGLSFTFLINAQKGFAEILESPLENITKALENWSLSGFKSGAAASRNDEIGRLARTLDELALKLEEEQQCREKDMENRRNFFNDISHELRTPVTALRAQVELLKDGLATEEELPEYYDNILQETLYIQELVDDLLTLSRLQAPGFTVEKVPCSLADILRDIYQSMSAVASEKGICLQFHQYQKSSDVMVMGNYTRLRQLILIFVENSIKYSDPGTQIEMILEDDEDGYRVTIADEGCGIPQQDMDKVFIHQYRASNTGSREGTGLGLRIAREIASLLNCTLQLESEEEKGTTVRIHLPRMEKTDAGTDF